jgi:lipopolysaccharide biosynthesis regulator YciM
MQKLHEDQRDWPRAYEIQTRLARLRKSDSSLVLGYLQAEMGREAAAAQRREAAETAFRTALSLDRRVFPAYLGLADLHLEERPQRAAAILEDAIQATPERAYLAFERISRAYTACGEPSRFVALCERIIKQNPREWRARLALARHLAGEGRYEDAHGLLMRAVEENPQVLATHIEAWRSLRALGAAPEAIDGYVESSARAVFYADPHICTVCRYRADDMLWRCPHCHEWNTFVEERVGAAAGAR